VALPKTKSNAARHTNAAAGNLWIALISPPP